MIGRLPSRILVIQTAFLGDVVLTTPLFRALKRVFPAASLSALVTPQSAPLLEEDPHLDALRTYDKNGRERVWAAMAKIRGGKFDLLIAPHRSHRTALLSLLSGAQERVGFADSGMPWAYSRRVARPTTSHEVDRNLALLRGVGAEPVPSDRELHVGYTETEQEEVDAVLSEAGVAAEDRLVGMCPGSVWATKRWLPHGFVEVGRRLAALGLRVVLIGGSGDLAVCRAVAEGIGPAAVDATGKTSLKALAAWMDRIRLLVTNDSAPLHVAAARDTPAVAIFGATTRDLGFYPLHTASRLVEADLPCRPCGLHGGLHCPQGHFRCMTEIRPEQVFAACLELLEPAGP